MIVEGSLEVEGFHHPFHVRLRFVLTFLDYLSLKFVLLIAEHDLLFRHEVSRAGFRDARDGAKPLGQVVGYLAEPNNIVFRYDAQKFPYLFRLELKGLSHREDLQVHGS